jgi:hypothetical protein
MDRRKTVQSLWSVDEPAESDPLFKIAVMARIEEYRFRRAVRAWLLKGVVLSLALWWLSPQLERIVADLEPEILYAASVLGAAGLYLSRLSRRSRGRIVGDRR